MSALDRIRTERARQIEKGYTPEHDDRHAEGQLVGAAMAYAVAGHVQPEEVDSAGDLILILWPWVSIECFHPENDVIRNLVRAAALLVAEIERLERLDG